MLLGFPRRQTLDQNILEAIDLKDVSANCVKIFVGKIWLYRIFIFPKMATDFLNKEIAAIY